MTTQKNTSNLKARISAMVMVLSLVWLTVSLPFVYNSAVQAQNTTANTHTDEEVPLNTTEEKAQTSTNFQEEYIHGSQDNLIQASIFLTHACSHGIGIYVAYHGELLSPPPESLS